MCCRHRQRHDLRLQHPDAHRLVLLQHRQRDGLHLHLLALPRALRTHQATGLCKAQGWTLIANLLVKGYLKLELVKMCLSDLPNEMTLKTQITQREQFTHFRYLTGVQCLLNTIRAAKQIN